MPGGIRGERSFRRKGELAHSGKRACTHHGLPFKKDGLGGEVGKWGYLGEGGESSKREKKMRGRHVALRLRRRKTSSWRKYKDAETRDKAVEGKRDGGNVWERHLWTLRIQAIMTAGGAGWLKGESGDGLILQGYFAKAERLAGFFGGGETFRREGGRGGDPVYCETLMEGSGVGAYQGSDKGSWGAKDFRGLARVVF